MRWLLAVLALVACQAAQAGEGFARLEGHGGPIKGVAVSADGGQALTASFDYSVALWDIAGGEPRFLYGHDAAANAVAFLPGQRAVSAGDDFSLILWDLPTGEALRRLEGHKGKILHIAVTQDGRMAATSAWDGWIGLWDLEAQVHAGWLKGHRSGVNAAAFSADGGFLYTGSSDGSIRRWNVGTGDLDRVLVKHGFGVNQLVLNEKSGWLAYGAVDGAVRAVDLATDRELADLTADRRPILALSFHPDSSLLAVGDGEGHVMVIDTGTWSIERDFRAAVRGPIWALAWTPDGKRLLSGGLDDTAALWPVGDDAIEVAGIQGAAEQSYLRPPEEMSNGERQFARKCSICHTLAPDGGHRAGPSLWGLFGRPAGAVEGYAYSDALGSMDIVWSAETINRLFEDGPDHYTPGSKMPMQRIARPEDRTDLIEYLAANTGPRHTGDRPK